VELFVEGALNAVKGLGFQVRGEAALIIGNGANGSDHLREWGKVKTSKEAVYYPGTIDDLLEREFMRRVQQLGIDTNKARFHLKGPGELDCVLLYLSVPEDKLAALLELINPPFLILKKAA
jgi:hypothetical protein